MLKSSREQEPANLLWVLPLSKANLISTKGNSVKLTKEYPLYEESTPTVRFLLTKRPCYRIDQQELMILMPFCICERQFHKRHQEWEKTKIKPIMEQEWKLLY